MDGRLEANAEGVIISLRNQVADMALEVAKRDSVIDGLMKHIDELAGGE